MSKCELCGEPMPDGEEMFKFHGYGGPCPKPKPFFDRIDWSFGILAMLLGLIAIVPPYSLVSMIGAWLSGCSATFFMWSTWDHRNALVAQLDEHRNSTSGDAGSSPAECANSYQQDDGGSN